MENQKKAYVLGGGYTVRDGIFRYKLSFAPTGETTFRVGMKVHSSERYDELSCWRAAWEEAHGRQWVPASGYFPQYRAPLRASCLPDRT
jgi:hypothetical protein